MSVSSGRKREPRDALDPRPSNHSDRVLDLPAAADLLAGQYELQDQLRDCLDHDAVAASTDARQLRKNFYRRELVFRLYPLAELCADQHLYLDLVRAAGRLRVLALPLPRRQASVLLAAVEPDGAAGGVRAAVLQPVFGAQPVRYAVGGGAGALPVQCAARGVDSRRFCVLRVQGA